MPSFFSIKMENILLQPDPHRYKYYNWRAFIKAETAHEAVCALYSRLYFISDRVSPTDLIHIRDLPIDKADYTTKRLYYDNINRRYIIIACLMRPLCRYHITAHGIYKGLVYAPDIPTAKKQAKIFWPSLKTHGRTIAASVM